MSEENAPEASKEKTKEESKEDKSEEEKKSAEDSENKEKEKSEEKSEEHQESESEEKSPDEEEKEESSEEEESEEKKEEHKEETVRSYSLEEAKDIETAKRLLSEAAGEISKKNTKLKTLEKQVHELSKFKEEVDKIKAREHSTLVDKVIKREMSLKIIGEKDDECRKKIYRKLSAFDLSKMLKNLENKGQIVIKRESLKGEGQLETDESFRKLAEKAGLTDKEVIDKVAKEK